MILLFMIFFLMVMAGNSFAFDCNNQIVSIGDTKVEVRAKCGEPASKEVFNEEIITKIEPNTRHRVLATVEEWTYHLGPHQFIRILTFRSGRLVKIETGGYGFIPDNNQDFGCERSIASTGDTKMEVRMKCGEPTSIDIVGEELLDERTTDDRRLVSVTIEEWTYNLGPNRFIRIFRFRNGRLAEIGTGGYGY
ncbi:MAG: DUF2845 domain-containing protein [Nitrospirae bacterium]|nr:DUF2845 domain-containing protein [Nitrospirota bacterium]